jgi:hypothetical protein
MGGERSSRIPWTARAAPMTAAPLVCALAAAALLAACGSDTGSAGSTAPSDPDEHTQPTPILGPDGQVVASGWARGPLFEYDPSLVPADRQVRIREWDFYAIQTPDFMANFVLARVAFESVGVAIEGNVTLHDYATGQDVRRGPTILSNPDALVLDPTPNGVYHLEDATGTIDYGHTDGARTIDFSLGDLIGHIELDDPVGDSLALVTPFPDQGEFFYENKAVALRARGTIDAGDTHYDVPADAPVGTMDWVRAVVPSQLDWTWATGQGEIDGHLVGLNLGSVFGDETHGTANAIIIDGHLNKLGRVDWTPDIDHPEASWHMTSADGRVDLTLEPTTGYVERLHVDLGFYLTDLWKPYGSWRGTVVLDDGTALDLSGLPGTAEVSQTTW